MRHDTPEGQTQYYPVDNKHEVDPKLLAITHGGMDRGYKLCRCDDCGEESICTPENDFYTTENNDNGPLKCERCFGRYMHNYEASYNEMEVSYALGSKSHINWHHIDGPMFNGKDGYIHWLTLMERLMFKCGAMTIADLEYKYNHGPCKAG